MLRLYLLPSLLLMLMFVQHVQAQFESDHIRENMEKFGKLRARWYRMHPVTYPPLPDDAKEFLRKYSTEKSDYLDEPMSIPEINGADAANLIEGDIFPSDEDIAELEERLRAKESGEPRAKRAASQKSAKNWPIDKPIPYTIRSGYNADQIQMIHTALKIMQNNTCINFKEDNGPGPKLEYYNDGDCGTLLGDQRKPWKNHYISLGDGCFIIKTVLHETMHALGFDHTQSRSDRDEYMDFNRDAISDDPRVVNQFELLPSIDFDNHSIPYEYNSVMHYPSRAYSKDYKTPVLVPKNLDYIASVGNMHGMTFNDWKQINLRYKCREVSCTSEILCLKGGFQNPRDCTRCVCPNFYSGRKCEDENNMIRLNVGSRESLTLEFDMKESSRDHLPVLEFSKFEKKLHLIKAPDGHRIHIRLDKVDTGEDHVSCIRECEHRAVEIVDEDLTLVGKRFCCVNATSHSFVSNTNKVGYQVYASPGRFFSSRVTFSLVPPNNSDVPSSTSDGLQTTPSQTENPSTAEPETEEPETVDPETIESETENPDTEEPETSQSSATDQTKEATTIQPGADKQSTSESVADESSTDDSEESGSTTDPWEYRHFPSTQ